jgi:hypothetical protein
MIAHHLEQIPFGANPNVHPPVVRSAERVRKSLSADSLQTYERWNEAFGDIS